MAAYLYNRSPNRLIDFITLFKKVYGIKPNLSYLRIIGSKAYVYILVEKRYSKLADRGKVY